MSARYAGIDHGTKRIGVAVSDPTGAIASPLAVVSAVSELRNQVRDVLTAVEEFDIDQWVVGLPINMDGSEGPQARVAQHFADELGQATNAPVHLWDERLSSLEADAHLDEAGATRKKKKARRDALAAQIILQSYLDAGTHESADQDAS